ncbi:hypothetical protein [Bradymonas sediminis]|uniref:Uncharacterized protein n=1 Tax=Bradymonas sediminis TaxID=1548548 RepID=A0A2Z4FHL9_9DELT|nr:hypothetical protein [Bradymonas sediminis]AWV88390.1 hypothetical protein DN745_03130 [Bradymonas sediminis]TDP77517.1 hypothetical protein DFR33_101419 [Bradymonas sediminis]
MMRQIFALDLTGATDLFRLPVIALAMLLSSCALLDAAGNSFDDPGDNSELDAAGDDAGPTPDITEERSAFADCVELNRDIDIDPTGMGQRYQPRVAFDGNAIWVVFTQADPNAANQYNIIASRVACGTVETGRVDTVTIKVNTAPIPVNSPAPSIDIQGETVHIVWNTELSAGSTAHSRVAYRAYNLAESRWYAQQESFVKFHLPGSTEPIDALGSGTTDIHFYDADIIAPPTGEAIITAVKDVVGQDSTHIVFQKLSTNGIVKDQASVVPAGPDSTQYKPSLTLDASGRVWIAAFEFLSSTNEDFLVYSSFAPQQLQPEETRRLPADPSRGMGPVFSKDIRGEDSVFLAYQATEFETNLLNAAESSESITLGASTSVSFYPALSSIAGRGAVAWFQVDDTAVVEQRSLNIQSFRQHATGLKLGEPEQVVEIDSVAAAQLPGGPGLVALGGDYYFAVYQNGPVGELTSVESTSLNGRFVKVSPPAE